MTVSVCVGRVGRAHGVRGEVAVEIRTDEPERRFAPGAKVAVHSAHPGLPDELEITGVRRHQAKQGERLLLRFAEVPDRTAAEALLGALLNVELPDDVSSEDPEEFYDHQLVGLRVEDEAGAVHGTVTDVLHHGAQDLLVIEVVGAAGAAGARREALVPFVAALVPTVDLAGGRVVVADRPGLLRGESS